MRKTMSASVNAGSPQTVRICFQSGRGRWSAGCRSLSLPLVPVPEAAAVAALVPGMRTASSLIIPAPLSPQLVQGLVTIQTVLAGWNRKLRPIPLQTAGSLARPGPAGRGVGLFFSGGVDSFYALLQRQQEITHLIFVHGFDLALTNGHLRREVAGRVRRIAEMFGKQLVELETDLRDFLEGRGGWYLSHGSAMAAVAYLLSDHLHKVYFAAPETFGPWDGCGTHELLDPHWSSEYLQFVQDSGHVTRMAKIEALAQEDIALAHLRVCWENQGNAYNCGRCEKCIRTMLMLLLAGRLDACTAFADRLDVHRVRNLLLTSPGIRSQYEQILPALEAHPRHAEMAAALRQALQANQSFRRFWARCRTLAGNAAARWHRWRRGTPGHAMPLAENGLPANEDRPPDT